MPPVPLAASARPGGGCGEGGCGDTSKEDVEIPVAKARYPVYLGTNY